MVETQVRVGGCPMGDLATFEAKDHLSEFYVNCGLDDAIEVRV